MVWFFLLVFWRQVFWLSDGDLNRCCFYFHLTFRVRSLTFEQSLVYFLRMIEQFLAGFLLRLFTLCMFFFS